MDKELKWELADGMEITYLGNGDYRLPDGKQATIEALSKGMVNALLVVIETIAEETESNLTSGALLHARLGKVLIENTKNSRHMHAVIDLLLEAPMMFHALTCMCDSCIVQRDTKGLTDLELMINHLERVAEEIRNNQNRGFDIPE